ncbi:MAG: RluA family pseudouridine synthase [Bacteroidales bacterium]
MEENFKNVADRILYEDNHVIIVNKLPSEIVQGDKTGDEPLSELVMRFVKWKYNKPGNVYIGVVHRLDRPVGGAVIFSKTSKALPRFNKMIQDKSITKKYWAIVKNAPPKDSDNLVHFLIRYPEKNKSVAYNSERRNSKKAELNYKVIAKSKDYYLLEIELLTGRHHQIRAQLAAIGCPIKGDLKYGFSRSNKGGSISLHARSLGFSHPVSSKDIYVEAPVPNQDPLWDYFSSVLKEEKA